jgi:hypothetical protein
MRGKTFLGFVTFAACSIFLAASISGCSKKKQAEGKESTQMPQLAKESSGADTSDIFKEFYSEDTVSKTKAVAASKKSAHQQTFSPAPQSPGSGVPEFSETGRYTVQISCVKSQSFANNMVSKMKEKGYPAYVAEVQNPTPNLPGTYYRVRIGGFDGLSAAKSFGENTLAASGYKYWVDKKSNDNVGMEGHGLGSGAAGSGAVGSYDMGGSSSSTYQSSPLSGFGSTTPAESSYSTIPSPGSSAETTSSSTGTTPTSSDMGSAGSASFASPSSTIPSTRAASPASGSDTSGSDTTGSSRSGWGKDTSAAGW